jgi:hypothetical protein
MVTSKLGSFSALFGLALAWGLTVAAPSANAASVTLTFGCSVSYATDPDSCGAPTGSFGTLTITDSTTNVGNAVDLAWNLTPGSGMGTKLSLFLLNYQSNSPPAATLSFSTPGSVANFSADGWDTGVPQYGQFDIRIGFADPNNPLSGVGTLTTIAGGLSALNFLAATSAGSPPLLALYKTFDGNGVYGAVPLPGTVALLGLGLVGIGAARRKQA